MTDKNDDDNGRPRGYGILTPIGGGKYTEIPGTERKLTAVEEAAEAFREAAEAAKEAGARKNELAEELVEAMRAANVGSYRYTAADGRKWRITTDTRTKATIKRGGSA